MSELITTASDLWNEISKTAQFQHKEYDMNMLQEIRGKLGLPSNGSIPVLLKKHKVSCEELLNAVLSCMQPFGEMLNDLYAMFQRAGAQQSNHNLKIQFDFNRNKETFATDLDFFRQQTESANQHIAQAIAEIPVHPFELCWKIKSIWQPNYLNVPQTMYPEDIQKWLQDYEACSRGSWPDYVPNKPTTGYPELNEQIENLWRILTNSLWKYRNLGRNGNQPRAEDVDFWNAEIDRWIGSYVRTICNLLIFFQISDPEQHATFAASASQEISHIISRCPMNHVTMEEIRRAVEDILNLPFWKKRYELYSVWTCSQILSAFPQNGVLYHVKDNTLSFSFSGSHIATLSSYDPPLELWAEVRTYYASPKGQTRKSHIQPDYTLAIGDAYNENQSIAVVECKQYKKYNRKNFLNAAEDYAGGRPNSNVFLVNYGPIASSLKDSTEEKYRDRIQFFGFVMPSTQETLAFQKSLKEAVDQYYNSNYRIKLPEYPFPEGSCTIRLKWNDLPKDLDLHMIVTSEGKKYHIAYNQRGSLFCVPFAMLNNDDQRGNGEESIRIGHMIDGKYDIYVHDYHDTEDISGAVTVLIEIDGQPRYAISRIEPIESGKTWHPYTISSGKIIPVNETVLFSEIEKEISPLNNDLT